MKSCPQWCNYCVANGLIYVAGAVFIPQKGFSATTGVESYRLLSYHRVTADGILVRPPSVLVSYPEPILHSRKQNTESAQSTNALPMLLGNTRKPEETVQDALWACVVLAIWRCGVRG